MPKKELNNPNKPAVKTRKVVTKRGDSVTVQTTGKQGDKQTTFGYDGKPALDKSGKKLPRTNGVSTKTVSGATADKDVKKRLRTNLSTADAVQMGKAVSASRAANAKLRDKQNKDK